MMLEISDLSILLVEPSHTQRRIIEEHLHHSLVDSIHGVSSGQEALAYLKRHNLPDLVISALYLPDMTSDQLLMQMRDSPELEHIPFMLLSSETREHNLEQIRQAGIVAILPKPFHAQDLHQALQASLALVDSNELQLQHQAIHELEVIMADDSRMARQYLRRMLENFGFRRIREAEDGLQALQLALEHPMDLLVTDYSMPKLDGQQLARKIRSLPQYARLPIMMVTSERNLERLAEAERAGVSTICDKPFESEQAKHKLATLLNDPNYRRTRIG